MYAFAGPWVRKHSNRAHVEDFANEPVNSDKQLHQREGQDCRQRPLSSFSRWWYAVLSSSRSFLPSDGENTIYSQSTPQYCTVCTWSCAGDIATKFIQHVIIKAQLRHSSVEIPVLSHSYAAHLSRSQHCPTTKRVFMMCIQYSVDNMCPPTQVSGHNTKWDVFGYMILRSPLFNNDFVYLVKDTK